jgi:2-methylaconitate cis-trans-isomerase PrpF
MLPEKIPAIFMRGGTSKALMFHRQDLPEQAEWDELFLALMGSPDPYMRQLNGMGGGVSSLSKVAILEKSNRPDADIDYTFGQVMINEKKVDYSGNCGNISSAVGPFAVTEGLVSSLDGENTVRIFNTNTKKIIHSTFEVLNGKPLVQGELEIPGVAGTNAPIRLDFLNPGGATTGKLLPTGNISDLIEVANIGLVRVTMIDAANACVFVQAKDIGLQGTEFPNELNQRPDILKILEDIRLIASVKMGISNNLIEAAQIKTVPYVGFVSPATNGVSISNLPINEDKIDLTARAISNGQPHLALPLTVSLCLGVAANIEGSVVADVLTKKINASHDQVVRIGMPSGILTVGAQVHQTDLGWEAPKGSFYRTARRLFEGFVYPQQD